MLDESSVVLRTTPTQLALINDTLLGAFLMDKRMVCIYSTISGRLTGSTRELELRINFDSLVRNSLPAAELDSIELLSPETDKELQPNRLQAFSVSSGRLQLLYLVEYEYKPRTEAGRKAVLESLPAMLRDKYKDTPGAITGIGAIGFLINSNERLHDIKITTVQFDHLPRTKNGAYSLLPGPGFFADENAIYLRVIDNPENMARQPGQHIRSDEHLPLLAALKNSPLGYRWDREILNTADIPDYDLPPLNACYSTLDFARWNDSLLVSTEAGIFRIPDMKKAGIQKSLRPGEVSMGSVKITDKLLLYTAGKPSPKGYLVPDSLMLCLLNRTTGNVDARLEFPDIAFVLRNDTVMAIGKNKEHYFISRYAIRND